VTDLRLPCDIVVTADWRLLAQPAPDFAPWVVIFAGNSIGLIYADHSAAAAEIDADNWYRVLARPGVRFGHSNPERDPAGYWTLIVWRLAERYYHRPGLAARLESNCPASNIRPKSIDFIPLLESGDLDYFFGYSSDARLGGLKFLKLPPQIDLEDPSRASEYASASTEIGTGRNRRRIEGAPIAYGATLTSDPPNRAAAIEFLKPMLGEAGRQIAARNGLIAYPASFAFDPRHQMPRELESLCRPFSR
jgi:molybdate/tungstate transport system substrate-binding protein